MINLRTMRWDGNAARMGEIRNAYIILDGKPGKKKQFERPGVETVYLYE
jgi:hypothetical protein